MPSLSCKATISPTPSIEVNSEIREGLHQPIAEDSLVEEMIRILQKQVLGQYRNPRALEFEKVIARLFSISSEHCLRIFDPYVRGKVTSVHPIDTNQVCLRCTLHR